MMILRIVSNDDYLPPSSAAALARLAKGIPGGRRVKALVFSRKEEFSIVRTDGTEMPNTLARELVKHYRVVHLRRDPHTGAGTVLLEVHFISYPQVHGGNFCECAESFCPRFWLMLALEREMQHPNQWERFA